MSPNLLTLRINIQNSNLFHANPARDPSRISTPSKSRTPMKPEHSKSTTRRKRRVHMEGDIRVPREHLRAGFFGFNLPTSTQPSFRIAVGLHHPWQFRCCNLQIVVSLFREVILCVARTPSPVLPSAQQRRVEAAKQVRNREGAVVRAHLPPPCKPHSKLNVPSTRL